MTGKLEVFHRDVDRTAVDRSLATSHTTKGICAEKSHPAKVRSQFSKINFRPKTWVILKISADCVSEISSV
jgi:hypothetical protein